VTNQKYQELYQAALTGQMTRREIVKRAAVLGLSVPALGALLAACADDDDDDTPAPPEPTESDDDEDEEEEPEEEEEEETPEPEEEDDEDEEEPETDEEPSDTDDIRITGPFEGESQRLNGAGATFPAVLYSRWFFEYEQVTGVRVNYQSIGSGGGIRSIQDQVVDFGGTDGPMTEEQEAEARGGHIFHIPMALGAVVATYNIPELELDEPLQFTADTLAGIYLGEITQWNDPALVEDNPQLADIDQNILVVHRSDGSGTTFIFTDYLSAVSEAWAENVGFGTSVNWPLGIGGNGNEGVAGEVNANAYSIGYVEYIYARQNDLGVATIQNQEGNWIVPTEESVTAAADGYADQISPDLKDRIVNAPGPDSYPISGWTWILAYENQEDEGVGIALTRLLWWCITDAQEWNAELGYAPVPESITEIAKGMIWDIKYDGEPVFPGQ
jgi:phosphate transport system substrate-binding protein